jgi:hypothetical protein
MNKLHDPELERFQRTIDLVEYAKKAGYEARPHDGAPGLTVLDHPNRDRIVVARSPDGPWIYASVPDYVPRGSGEPEAQAVARLRHCIHRTTDKGSIVEFVQERDSARRGEVSLERVRERLRAFEAIGLALDSDGALRPPPYGQGRKGPTDPARDGPQTVVRPDPELHRRRYDWTPPPPGGPHETQLEQRLRRWREAQTAIDMKLQRRSELPGRDPPPAPVAPQAKAPAPPAIAPGDPTRQAGPPNKSELHRRRYDWTPQPAGIETLRGARNRSPGRDR